MSETTERPAIETAYLRLPADDAAGLRDFIRRAEADLASPTGLSQTWPAFAGQWRSRGRGWGRGRRDGR